MILRRFVLCLLFAWTLPMLGCAPSENGSASSGTTASGATMGAGGASGEPKPTNSSGIKAGLVTDAGGVGDRSFNQSAWEGLQKAGADLGLDVKYTESRRNSDYVSNLSRYAQGGYAVVFAVGFLMSDAVKEVAAKYPNVQFAIIDGDSPNLPNVVAYKFREEEGSFLAGALAGLVTKTNKIGFVGGVEMELIQKFEVGYTAGAKSTNPKIQVLTGYAGKFTDPQKGQELAISQMGAGADIIYHAAGATGTGVIKAVQDKGAGFYAIGVDKDQDGDAPGRVLTSMVKGIGVAVMDVCRSVKEDKFKAGTVELGLKENGVGLSEMRYTKQDVPAASMAIVDTLRAQIVSGKLKPPTTKAQLATFRAPMLKPSGAP